MNIYQNIVDKSLIDKGWSGDQKYCAVTSDGSKYLLRISSIERLERKRTEGENTVCDHSGTRYEQAVAV